MMIFDLAVAQWGLNEVKRMIDCRLIVYSVCASLICGCATDDYFSFRKAFTPMRSEYFDHCKFIALQGKNPEDWDEWYGEGKYQIVYSDEKYLSFRYVEYLFLGGAHGGRCITIRTFDRKTGKVLKASDFIPENKRKAVKSALYDAVLKNVGDKSSIFGEVKIVDNCCIMKDGIHFVYNEYEVAPFAVGAIDVTVKVSSDSQKVTATGETFSQLSDKEL